MDPEVEDLLRADHGGSLSRVLQEMVDVRILANPLFALLCVAHSLGFLALYIPYVYLPGLMVSAGLSTTWAAAAVSCVGITNTVGRVIVGWLVDSPREFAKHSDCTRWGQISLWATDNTSSLLLGEGRRDVCFCGHATSHIATAQKLSQSTVKGASNVCNHVIKLAWPISQDVSLHRVK